jgi:hypothetical protein
VLVAGGFGPGDNELVSAELYDSTSGPSHVMLPPKTVQHGSSTRILPGALPLGAVFTTTDNTAATQISGLFINLSDHSPFTVGSNTFQATTKAAMAMISR